MLTRARMSGRWAVCSTKCWPDEHHSAATYEQAIVCSILNEEPDRLDDVAEPLRDVVRKCLAKNGRERYRDEGELHQALLGLRLDGPSVPAAADSKAETRPSVIVLPFQNRSRDEDDEYFSDGVTEDIISTLGIMEGLRVIPRASAFHFKGKRPSLAELVILLNVTHVLEGSVRRAGKKLRITVELVETADGEQLWTQRYDRVLDDIFEVQDEISESVAEVLKVKLLGNEILRPARRGTTNVEATTSS